jgi:DNA-binding HxlR family transcriptional regulator
MPDPDPSKSSIYDLAEAIFSKVQNKNRMDVLRILLNTAGPVKFSHIKEELKSKDSSSLSHTIKPLTEANLVQKNSNELYELTPTGQVVADQIVRLLDYLQSQSEAIKVRTSKYTIEPFDSEKIAQTLMIEANMPANQAETIAKEVKKRLESASVPYMTTPLIREFVNGILIEQKYTKYRHLLTRLGIPPYEISKLIHSGTIDSIAHLGKLIGKSTLEQYCLLNQLVPNHADKILDGSCHVRNLAAFPFLPLELVISGQMLLDALESVWRSYQEELVHVKFPKKITKEFHELQSKLPTSASGSDYLRSLENSSDIGRISGRPSLFSQPFPIFIEIVTELIRMLIRLFPNGMSIIKFDDFLSRFLLSYKSESLYDFLNCISNACHNLDSASHDLYPITLQFSSGANAADISPLLTLYFQSLSFPIHKWTNFPVLHIHLTKQDADKIKKAAEFSDISDLLQLILSLASYHQVNLDHEVLWGKPDWIHFVSNTNVSITIQNPKIFRVGIILDSILINLPQLALDAGRNENEFFTQISQYTTIICDIFDHKFELLSKNLKDLKLWSKFEELFLNGVPFFENQNELQKYNGNIPFYCGIGVYGLDDAIFLLHGLQIRETPKNRILSGEILEKLQGQLNRHTSSYQNCHFMFATPSPEAFWVHPPNLNLVPFLSEEYEKKQKPAFTEFSLLLHFPDSAQPLDRYLSQIKEITAKFENLTAGCLLSSDLGVSDPLFLSAIQKLLDLPILRFGFTRIYSPQTVGTLSESPKYTRYHGRYFPDSPEFSFRASLFNRKDQII